MKTATVRELRNHYSSVMKWIEDGEEVRISRRGKIVARLVPERPDKPKKVDWSTSAAVLQDKSKWPRLTKKQTKEFYDGLKGPW
jgi:prevent-host-death family protein